MRDYVLKARSKGIATNWPFSLKHLQLCVHNGIKQILPPMELYSPAIKEKMKSATSSVKERPNSSCCELDGSMKKQAHNDMYSTDVSMKHESTCLFDSSEENQRVKIIDNQVPNFDVHQEFSSIFWTKKNVLHKGKSVECEEKLSSNLCSMASNTVSCPASGSRKNVKRRLRKRKKRPLFEIYARAKPAFLSYQTCGNQ
ncbi:hypothetical protein HPP92_005983 [Vanilla planifolia]|uniref:Uncharacterized protein n=1 Tax=Vanilla planifolia TaxID=51239 RepID=A0A835RNN7_VANPL|nr:hypothetical protein HPP92_005983 [Vanilla planifolia]